MTRPRAFIGSSVEGLSIAYAIQQNLMHDAEITVWDQGVFELSQTTIESLTKTLSETDFAIFVFTPDDLARIKNKKSSVVRDNVLFEFGLFIGRIGRERVFFLVPTTGKIHLPTDLLGVTPGKYDPSRSDGSMQAATGPACHQIRLRMKSLGALVNRSQTQSGAEDSSSSASNKRSWIQDFFDEKYDSAKATLEEGLKQQSGDDALATSAWILYCDFKRNNVNDLESILDFAKQNSQSSRTQDVVASILRFEKQPEMALALLTNAQANLLKDTTIAKAIALCHVEFGDNVSAIAELQRVGPDEFPDVALELAEVFERDDKKDEALKVVQSCHAKHRNHKELRYKYARLAMDLNLTTIAVYLLDDLCSEDPKSIDYWGYLGNACLQLELYDKALISYRKAEALMIDDQGSQWIVSNIGNLFNNKGLPTEASIYLERALKYEPKSEYAHNRLAMSLKNKDDETKEFRKKYTEGRRLLIEAAAKFSTTQ